MVRAFKDYWDAAPAEPERRGPGRPKKDRGVFKRVEVPKDVNSTIRTIKKTGNFSSLQDAGEQTLRDIFDLMKFLRQGGDVYLEKDGEKFNLRSMFNVNEMQPVDPATIDQPFMDSMMKKFHGGYQLFSNETSRNEKAPDSYSFETNEEWVEAARQKNYLGLRFGAIKKRDPDFFQAWNRWLKTKPRSERRALVLQITLEEPPLEPLYTWKTFSEWDQGAQDLGLVGLDTVTARAKNKRFFDDFWTWAWKEQDAGRLEDDLKFSDLLQSETHDHSFREVPTYAFDSMEQWVGAAEKEGLKGLSRAEIREKNASFYRSLRDFIGTQERQDYQWSLITNEKVVILEPDVLKELAECRDLLEQEGLLHFPRGWIFDENAALKQRIETRLKLLSPVEREKWEEQLYGPTPPNPAAPFDQWEKAFIAYGLTKFTIGEIRNHKFKSVRDFFARFNQACVKHNVPTWKARSIFRKEINKT